jgi:hypothetical protein
MSELNNVNKGNSSIGTSDIANEDSNNNITTLLQTPDNANIQPTFRVNYNFESYKTQLINLIRMIKKRY